MKLITKLSNLEQTEKKENKVVKLDATYNNPQIEVDMKIEYNLNSER